MGAMLEKLARDVRNGSPLDSAHPRPTRLHIWPRDRGSRRTIALAASGALLAALAAAVVGAPAAQAAIWGQFKIDNQFAASFDECGITIDYTWEGTGIQTVRTIAGTDQAYLGSANIHADETWTNSANGKWFAGTSHINIRDTSGTHIEGDLWRFDTKTTIGNATYTSSDGTVIYRDSGLVRDYSIFDTLGDHQPGGEVVDGGFIRANGHFTSPDFCELVTSQLL